MGSSEDIVMHVLIKSYGGIVEEAEFIDDRDTAIQKLEDFVFSDDFDPEDDDAWVFNDKIGFVANAKKFIDESY